MKHCPTCQTEFDEEIIRFCTKDGTPLVEDTKPSFTENLPSETSQDDDYEGEATIIRRKQPKSSGSGSSEETSVNMSDDTSDGISPKSKDSKRIVISTSETQKKEQNIRSKESVEPRHTPPPQKSNTALVVVMTMFGTVALLLGVLGIWWFLSSQNANDANSNLNVNENIAINSNLNENIDSNFNLSDFNINSNSNANSDTNLDLNINTNTPTPTRTPNPTPTPTPTPTPDSNTNTNTNTNVNVKTPTPSPTATPVKTPIPVRTPTPTPTPVKTPIPSPTTNDLVSVGTINGRAVRLPTPSYTSEARQARASGRVLVSVTVDERGNVINAKATSGHPLLLKSAESAALRSKFRPVSVNGNGKKAIGTVIYNFVN